MSGRGPPVGEGAVTTVMKLRRRNAATVTRFRHFVRDVYVPHRFLIVRRLDMAGVLVYPQLEDA